jgi:hypothetical protein
VVVEATPVVVDAGVVAAGAGAAVGFVIAPLTPVVGVSAVADDLAAGLVVVPVEVEPGLMLKALEGDLLWKMAAGRPEALPFDRIERCPDQLKPLTLVQQC